MAEGKIRAGKGKGGEEIAMSKYNELHRALNGIAEKKEKIRQEWEKVNNDYNNKEASLQRLLLMGSEKDIEALRAEVEGLRLKSYQLKAQIDAWGDVEGMTGVRHLISESPGSVPYALALEVIDEETALIAEYSERARTLTEVDLPAKRTAYLETVFAIGQAFGDLYSAHGRGKIAAECIGKDERRLPPLRAIAPISGSFIIDMEEIHAYYGNKPIKPM